MTKSKTKIRENINIRIDPKSKRIKKARQSQKVKAKGNVKMEPYTKELACSILDPFACSACVPDGRTNTGCFTLKDTGVLGTGAGGNVCGIAICGDLAALVVRDTAGTSPTNATIASNWSVLSAATLAAQYAAYRPVSYGIRLNYIGNTQTDQGVIVVGQLGSQKAVSDLNSNGVQSFASQLSDYRQFALRNGCQITWRPESMEPMTSWNYVGTSTFTGQVTSALPISGSNVLVAWVFGASANTASLVQYEIVINFEGQYKQQNYISGGLQSVASLPRAEVGWYEKMKNVIDAVTPIIPLVGSALTSAGMPVAGTVLTTLGSLGNGIRYPAQYSRSSLR